jgi:cytochrome d ubiquinol oxidase subunit I
VFGFPDQEAERTDYAVHIPYVMGIIATRTLDEPVTGIKELKAEHRKRIETGMKTSSAGQYAEGSFRSRI